MDANGLLVAFGVALIVFGSMYRTPFPVQPMKAIGAAAVSQATLAAGFGSAVGVVMGLGFSFMLEGIHMMSTGSWVAGLLLAVTLVLLGRPRVPAMLVLLTIGVAMALINEPDLMRELGALKPEFRIPTLAWGTLSMSDLWTGLILLSLPQLPLTFGNAYLSITEENNRLFPDRAVTERSVAFSTGLMNLGSSLVGGSPMRSEEGV